MANDVTFNVTNNKNLRTDNNPENSSSDDGCDINIDGNEINKICILTPNTTNYEAT